MLVPAPPAEPNQTLTRRRVMRLGTLALAGSWAGLVAERAEARHRPPTATATGRAKAAATATATATGSATGPATGAAIGPSLRVAGTARPTASATPHPGLAVHRAVRRVDTWRAPIRTLDDYLTHAPASRFNRNAIMLTIDDGPDPEWTPRYLRLLAKYHVTATFCVIGRQVGAHGRWVRAAVSEGHHVANHTWDHPLNLPSLSAARIRSELADTTDAIVRASGFEPRQFRAPGGIWSPEIIAEAARAGMLPLGWDVDPRDWSLPGAASIISSLLAARPHDILLCHDGGGDRSETFAALQRVIPALLARGWSFVTLPR